MDERFARIIADYLGRIQEAVRRLEESGIPLPKSQIAWADTDVPMMSSLVNKTTYYQHGFGIKVKWDGQLVEFDFGPEGQTDCIDLHFLIYSFKDSLQNYGFESKEELIKLFWRAETLGEICPITHSLFQIKHDSNPISEWSTQSNPHSNE